MIFMETVGVEPTSRGIATWMSTSVVSILVSQAIQPADGLPSC